MVDMKGRALKSPRDSGVSLQSHSGTSRRKVGVGVQVEGRSSHCTGAYGLMFVAFQV